MSKTDIAFRIAHAILRFIVVLSAASLLVYGCYVILDTLSVERNAFVSSELLKYKPTTEATTETIEYNLQDLEEINPDVLGWLEINQTNVDYPVVQGEDELEYSHKDPFGNNSVTGSIYLSSTNSKNLEDFYNIIYGHNMDAGAMFGDIAKYVDEDYFNNHRSGRIFTDDKVFDFNIFAVVKTDAYESTIYTSSISEKEDAAKLIDFVNRNKLHGDVKTLDDLTKVVAFSTCEQADTNGRIVVFADCFFISDSAPIEEGTLGQRNPGIEFLKKIVAQNVDYWALLNVLCVIGSFLTLFPIACSVKKFKMFGYSKKVKKEIDDDYDRIAPYIDGEDGTYEKQEKYAASIKKFRRKIRFGIIMELILAIAALLWFLHTEDVTKKLVFVDENTPLMVALFAASLVVDIICFTYRGIELPQIIDDLINEG